MLSHLILSILFASSPVLHAPAAVCAERSGDPNETEAELARRMALGLFSARLGQASLEKALGQAAQDGPEGLFLLIERGHAQLPLDGGGNQVLVLNTEERYAVAHALRAFEWGSLREPLAELLDDDARRRGRLVEALVLRSPRTDLDPLFDALQPLANERRIGREELGQFEQALVARLAVGDGFLNSLPELMARTHPSGLMSLLRAVGSEAHPDRMRGLVDSLGSNVQLDELLLAEIAHQARRLRGPFDRILVEEVRGYLGAENRSTQAQAISAAQEFGDRGAMRELVKYLDSKDAGLRQVAQQALEKISGTTAGRGAVAWTLWLNEADAWYREHSPGLLDAVGSGNSAEAARALLDLSKWSYFGPELVEGVAVGLQRREPSVQQLSCSTLGALNSLAALPYLKAALGSQDQLTASAAYLSLRRLTGEDYGDQAQAWTEAGW